MPSGAVASWLEKAGKKKTTFLRALTDVFRRSECFLGTSSLRGPGRSKHSSREARRRTDVSAETRREAAVAPSGCGLSHRALDRGTRAAGRGAGDAGGVRGHHRACQKVATGAAHASG